MENTAIDEYLLLKKCGFAMENTPIDEYLLLKNAASSWKRHQLMKIFC